MKRATKLVVSIAALGTVAASACTSTTEPTGETVIRIGVVTSLTGDLAPFGPAIGAATELAAELANEVLTELESPFSVEVFVEDDEAKDTAGVEAARKLVDTDNAAALIGALASGVTVPIAESVAVPKGVVQITPASTAASLTPLEDEGLVFRTVPTDVLQAQLVATQMADIFGETATLNVGARNDAYGAGLADAFAQLWTDGGGTIGSNTKWDPDAASFASEAAEIAEGEPDGWFLVDFPETWKKMGAALQDTGTWDITKTFTADGLKSTTLADDVGEDLANGLRGTGPGPAQEGFAADVDLWQSEWDARLDVERNAFNEQTFDAAMVIILAALAAQDGSAEGIASKLGEVSGPAGTEHSLSTLSEAITAVLAGEDIDYQGVSGLIDFDENGDPTPEGATYEVWTYDNGELTVDETVNADTI